MQETINWIKATWWKAAGLVIFVLAYLFQRERQKTQDLTRDLDRTKLEKALGIKEANNETDKAAYEKAKSDYNDYMSSHPELRNGKREE